MALLAPPQVSTPDNVVLADAIADLRDEAFTLVESARRDAPHELAALHVSLQSAANELGRAERLLRASR